MEKSVIVSQVFKKYSDALKFIWRLSHEAKKEPLSVVIKPCSGGYKATYQERS